MEGDTYIYRGGGRLKVNNLIETVSQWDLDGSRLWGRGEGEIEVEG